MNKRTTEENELKFQRQKRHLPNLDTKEHRGNRNEFDELNCVRVDYGSASGHPERPATSRSNRYFPLGVCRMDLRLAVENVLLDDGGQWGCV